VISLILSVLIEHLEIVKAFKNFEPKIFKKLFNMAFRTFL